MSPSFFLLLLSLPLCFSFLGMGRKQSVAVVGRLFCNGFPAAQVRVKLYDQEILFDSQLAVTYSNQMGVFTMSGSKREFTNIDPRLYIYHRCNYQGACLKKAEIDIPDRFISSGGRPYVTADLGVIDLNGKFSRESVDCIN